LDGLRTVPDNPIGLLAPTGALESIGGLLWPALSACLIGAAISVVVRSRRARGVERQQLRWFAWSCSVVLVGTLLMTVGGAVYGEEGLPPLLEIVATALVGGGLASLPVSVTVAILRYRLYELDRIISRTISYAVVVVVLGAMYAAGVVLFGRALTPLGAGNDVTVAGATLAAAALFRPLLHRVRSIVDRRFDRARYDAQHTVEGLIQQLRYEVDLEELRGALLAAVEDTMAPVDATVWLPHARRARPRGPAPTAPARDH
jgi:hypothetical protein